MFINKIIFVQDTMYIVHEKCNLKFESTVYTMGKVNISLEENTPALWNLNIRCRKMNVSLEADAPGLIFVTVKLLE